jgi:hypothetical protein
MFVPEIIIASLSATVVAILIAIIIFYFMRDPERSRRLCAGLADCGRRLKTLLRDLCCCCCATRLREARAEEERADARERRFVDLATFQQQQLEQQRMQQQREREEGERQRTAFRYSGAAAVRMYNANNGRPAAPSLEDDAAAASDPTLPATSSSPSSPLLQRTVTGTTTMLDVPLDVDPILQPMTTDAENEHIHLL